MKKGNDKRKKKKENVFLLNFLKTVLCSTIIIRERHNFIFKEKPIKLKVNRASSLLKKNIKTLLKNIILGFL